MRGAPRFPVSVRAGSIRRAVSRSLSARYTRGRRTEIAIDSASSSAISAATPNPCRGSSTISAKTTWSIREGSFSLIETMRVARLVAGLSLVAGLVASPELVSARSLDGEIVISAAASLTGSFTELGKAFRKANPRVRVRFNFASTSSLVNQIQSGAPVSVFASADLASHERLARSGHLATSPRIFARNSMQIAVKPGNPLKVRGVADLGRVGTIALCSKTIPCGVYSSAVLSRGGVRISESSISRGVDAKATLASVAFGDANAAIVYVTDVKAAGKSVSGVVIPPSHNVSATYGISVVRGAPNPRVSRAFVDFVLSKSGQAILARNGFRAR